MRVPPAMVAGVFVIAAAVALLTPLPKDVRTRWVNSALNLAHVPLFASVTVLLWWAGGRRWWLAVGLALALAGCAEVCQPLVGRSGNVLDFLRGIVGILVVAVIVKAFERPLRAWRLTAGTILTIALLAWPIVEVLRS